MDRGGGVPEGGHRHARSAPVAQPPRVPNRLMAAARTVHVFGGDGASDAARPRVANPSSFYGSRPTRRRSVPAAPPGRRRTAHGTAGDPTEREDGAYDMAVARGLSTGGALGSSGPSRSVKARVSAWRGKPGQAGDPLMQMEKSVGSAIRVKNAQRRRSSGSVGAGPGAGSARMLAAASISRQIGTRGDLFAGAQRNRQTHRVVAAPPRLAGTSLAKRRRSSGSAHGGAGGAGGGPQRRRSSEKRHRRSRSSVRYSNVADAAQQADVLHTVLEFIPVFRRGLVCSRVCRAWRAAVELSLRVPRVVDLTYVDHPDPETVVMTPLLGNATLLGAVERFCSPTTTGLRICNQPALSAGVVEKALSLATRLEELDLSNTAVRYRFTEQAVSAITNLSTLTALTMLGEKQRPVPHVLLLNLPLIAGLRRLELSVWDAAAQRVIADVLKARKELLTTVKLDHSWVGPDIVVGASHCRQLHTLSFRDCRLTLYVKDKPAIADALVECVKLPQLTSLDLCNNRLPESVGARIVAELSQRSCLRTLGLSENELGEDAGAGLGFTLAPILLSNPRIVVLELGLLRLADVDVVALVSALPALRALAVLSLANNLIGDSGGEALRAFLVAHDYGRIDVDLDWNRFSPVMKATLRDVAKVTHGRVSISCGAQKDPAEVRGYSAAKAAVDDDSNLHDPTAADGDVF